jgi:hypothetical protein
MKKILGKKEIIKKYHFCPYLELISKTKADTQEPKLCTIGLTLSIIIYHACNSKSENGMLNLSRRKCVSEIVL